MTASDFTLSHSSTGGGGATTTTTTGQFTQTRSQNLAIPYDNVVSDTVTVSDSGTATSVSVAVGITHAYIQDLKIDLVAPDGTTETLHDNSGGNAHNINQTYTPSFESVAISGAWTLKMHDNYVDDSGFLNSWTLTINYGDTTTTTVSPVTDISGSGDTYYVTVSSTTDGTYNLDLASSDHNIVDTANNPLINTATTGADQTYTVSTAVIDNTNPRLASIERSDPASQNTDSPSLRYKATFSESVTGVTASDFVLSTGSTGRVSGTTQVTGISGSGDTYYVTVSSSTVLGPTPSTATGDGTYNLDLVLSGHNIADAASNPLINTATTGADQTYTVSTTVIDNTNPRLASIERYSPTSQNTGSQPLRYKATFSENVTGVTASDFVLSPSSTGRVSGTTQVTGISGSGDTYYVTVSPSTDGTYNLDLASSDHNIVDTANNPLINTATTGADQTYTVSTTVIDNTNPRLASIERYTPASQNTDSQSLRYKATFSENVTGVTASDFTLSHSSTGGGGATTTTTTGQFTQTRSQNLAIPYDNVVSDTVTVSDSGTATSVSVAVDITHAYIQDLKIDLVAPDGTTETLHDNSGGNAHNINQTYTPSFESVAISGAWTLKMHDNYVDDSGFLNSWTLTINYGDTTTTTVSPVTDISGSGDTYYVTVSSTTDGTYNLDLASSDHNIVDTANNPLINTATTGADQTYTVSTAVIDNTNPRLASIERYIPASQNTDSPSLRYKATFSESVTGVTASDFVLSTGSTGRVSGTTQVTGISGSGDTYYVTVSSSTDGTYNLDLVLSGHNIADAASNPLINTATTGADQTYTVSTTVVDSPNPTLESIERHQPASQNTDSLFLVYKVTFSESVTGVTESDFTLSHGSTGGRDDGTSSVTGVSGSGDTYYVTVLSFTDGTYNLDLVLSGHNIVDTANNPLTNTSTTGADQTYTVSTTVVDSPNPTLESIERHQPASQNTNNEVLIYKVTFSKSVTGVDTSDFVLSPGSTGGRDDGESPIAFITSFSDDAYYVIVSLTVDGTCNLDLVSSGHGIADAADNPLINTVPTTGIDQTYTKI